MPENLTEVPFASVSLGQFFKPAIDDIWHLKNTAATGAYQRFGTRYEPPFRSDAMVFVEK